MWRDTTTYSRFDKKRTPTTFTAIHGSIKITVTCGHVRYKPDWIMHCFALGIDTKPLGNCNDAQEATDMAIGIVKDKIQNLSTEITLFSPLSIQESIQSY